MELITNRLKPQLIGLLAVVEYICLPLITIGVIILAAYLFKKYLTVFWNVITSARG